MKDKIKNIAEKLEHQIRMHELDLNDRIKDIPQIILLLEQGFSELKEIVSFYKFKSEMDEIFFFKIIKPKFFSKLIYYRKVYNIEMMRPNGQDCVLKNYFINELNQLENFYNKNKIKGTVLLVCCLFCCMISCALQRLLHSLFL